MGILRVCFMYVPWLYRDIFQRVCQKIDRVEIIHNLDGNAPRPAWGGRRWRPADVVVLSLDSAGSPDMSLVPCPLPDTGMVAFSPRGDLGFWRNPRENTWQRIEPFGVTQLMQAIQNAGTGDQGYPAATMGD